MERAEYGRRAQIEALGIVPRCLLVYAGGGGGECGI